MQLVMKDGQYGLMMSPSRIYWVDDAEALRAFVGMYNRSQGYSVQHSDQQTPLVTGLCHDQARVVADALTDASGLPYGVVHPVQVNYDLANEMHLDLIRVAGISARIESTMLTPELTGDPVHWAEKLLHLGEGTVGQQVMQLVENNPLNVDELGDIVFYCLTPAGLRQLRKKIKAMLNPTKGVDDDWQDTLFKALKLSGMTWGDFLIEAVNRTPGVLSVDDVLKIAELDLNNVRLKELRKKLKEIIA